MNEPNLPDGGLPPSPLITGSLPFPSIVESGAGIALPRRLSSRSQEDALPRPPDGGRSLDRRVVLRGILGIAIGGVSGSAPLAGAGRPIRHSFLCTDNGHGKVFEVSADGRIRREFAAEGCQDAWRLRNGRTLFTHVRGVREAAPDGRVVWEYRAPESAEVHGCQPLRDGGVLVCECGTRRLIEVERSGRIRREIPLETSVTNTHLQFRVARKLRNGRYLVAFVGERVAREVDTGGRVAREIPTPGDLFVAIRLRDGNTLIGCGDGHRVIEVDPEGRVVWEVAENDLPGNPLRFVAGLHRLPNGNTVVCNWGGHGYVGKQPQVFEVTRGKRVVWRLDDPARFQTISSIQILDAGGDAVRGTIQR